MRAHTCAYVWIQILFQEEEQTDGTHLEAGRAANADARRQRVVTTCAGGQWDTDPAMCNITMREAFLLQHNVNGVV